MNIASLGRLAIKEGVLSDGTIVPPGWTVAVLSRAVHRDPSIYPNPDTFDPFRFAKLRKEADSDVKYGFATLDNSHLVFGVGRHACPGRFLYVTLSVISLKRSSQSIYSLAIQRGNGAQNYIGNYFTPLGCLFTRRSEGKTKEYGVPNSGHAPSQSGVGFHEAVDITTQII